MRRNNTYKMKRKAGFTLVEMIVVLVMLAILAAVAVPTYTSYVDSNKAKQCEVERKAIASRLEEMQTMQVTGSDSAADTTKYAEYVASQECPAGGAYTFEKNTIVCSHPEHGETTVLLKTDIGVTAKASTQTEAPTEAPEPTSPPANNSTPLEPKLTLSLSPNPLSVMEVGGTQPLTANAVPTYCDITGYSWSVSGSAVDNIESNGKDVTVHAKQAGEATITCTVNAQSQIEGKTVTPVTASVTVKVNEKPVNLTISINPVSISMAPNASENLTAVVTNKEGCTDIDSYTWNVEPKGVIEIEESGEKVGVKATGTGSCTVTCTATAVREDGNGSVDSNVAKASVVVQEREDSLPDVLIKGSWNKGGSTADGTHLQLTDIKGVHVPPGGKWRCSDPRVYVGDNSYVTIADNGAGDTYEFIYTTPEEQELTLHARMVYEITGLHSTHSDNFTMRLGEQESFSAIYQPDYITDGPVRWSCTDENVIRYAPGGTAVNGKGTPMDSDVTVTAAAVGDTTLTASVYNEYESWLNGVNTWKTFSWKIKVEYKTITGVTADQLILQAGGESQQLQFATIPSEGTDPRVSFKCVGTNNPDCVGYTETGLVTPKHEGTAIIYIKAYLDEKEIASGSCTVVVTGDPNTLTAIGLSPERIDLIQGQTAKIVTDGTAQKGDISVYPIPSGTSLDGSTYTFRSNDSNIATVDSSGLITASTSNTGQVPIYVEAWKDNKGYTGTVYVNVLPDPTKLSGIRMEPGKISIVEGQQARIAPVTLGNSDAEVKIFPQPDTASFEGATYTYQSYNEGAVRVSADGVITAGSGDGVVGQTAQIHVTVKQNNREYYGDIYVTVASDPLKLTGINLKPDTINIMEGQQATISTDSNSGSDTVIYPLPTTASLEGVEFSYSVSDSSISVSQDGVITGERMTNSKQTVTVTATKGDQSFTGYVYVNVAKDPDRLSDFWIEPVSVQEGFTATVVKHLTPEKPDLTDVVFDYKSDDASVATVSSDDVVTGHKVGNTNIRVKALKNGKVLVDERQFSVTVKPAPPTKFTIEGNEYAITPWETLREYIQKKQSGESVSDLPTPAFFLDYSSENDWKVYVLKKDASMAWDASFSETTSFNEFYNRNGDVFGRVANNYYSNSVADIPSKFTDWGDQWYSCNLGAIIRRNGKIYIAVDNVPNGPLKNWTEDFFNNHFAEMISLG